MFLAHIVGVYRGNRSNIFHVMCLDAHENIRFYILCILPPKILELKGLEFNFAILQLYCDFMILQLYRNLHTATRC